MLFQKPKKTLPWVYSVWPPFFPEALVLLPLHRARCCSTDWRKGLTVQPVAAASFALACVTPGYDYPVHCWHARSITPFKMLCHNYFDTKGVIPAIFVKKFPAQQRIFLLVTGTQPGENKHFRNSNKIISLFL